MDFSVLKDTHLTEALNMQFRAVSTSLCVLINAPTGESKL
jgi:hypothetical protein